MNADSQRGRRIEQTIGMIVLLALLIGSFLVLQPFISSLAWAFVLAFSLWPVFRRLVASLGNRRTMASLIMTLAIALALVVPTVAIVTNLAQDARELGTAAKRWVQAGPPAPPAWLQKIPVVGNRIATYWQDLADDAATLLRQLASSATDQQADVAQPLSATQPIGHTKLGQTLAVLVAWARRWIPVVGLAILNGLTQITLSVFLTFFIFRDGLAIGQRLDVGIQRIAGQKGSHLLEVAGSTVRGVVYGILGTALIQGVLVSFGALIAGVPGAALLGLITFILSPIPMGPPLVWLPASLWLFHQGSAGWGTFMLIWGIGVSSIDNVVKPMIISRGSATPFILILFGVLGGALAFGFIGVFLGPTLLAVAFRLIEEWSRETALGNDGPTSASRVAPHDQDALLATNPSAASRGE
jgi:predicted PurR-regulated permease PerM